jgi:hypothetical protein
MNDVSKNTEAHLTALADGSLDPERRAEVLAEARASRELDGALAEQRRAVELLRSVGDVRAPEVLHRRVQTLVGDHAASAKRERSFGWRHHGGGARHGSPLLARRRTFRSRRGLAGVTAITAGAAAILTILLSMTGGGSTAPTVAQASALALRPATIAAPAENHAHRTELAYTVDGIPFPYWGERFGWRSTGARTDHIGKHLVTTVFYTDARGLRIGYSILAGSPPHVRGGAIAQRGGVPYRLLTEHGAAVVAWWRSGHLCVVSGRGVDSPTLLRLASWDDDETRAS